MTLKEALGLGLHGENMLSLIGAGGKTTTLFRLARELSQEGARVLVSTTTRIFKPTSPHVHKLFLARDLEALRSELGKIKGGSIVGVGCGLDQAGKLIGLPPAWFDALAEHRAADWILVEADGAASRPFKVPLEHEPVVPERCPLTVWVMGIKVLSRPLTAEWVHRAQRAEALLGAEPGAPLTRDTILRLLRHPSGCLQGVPAGSRTIGLINQADTLDEIERARELARESLLCGLERVVITSYLDSDAVKDVIGGEVGD